MQASQSQADARSSVPREETFYDGWARGGTWRWEGLQHARRLVNRSITELQHVRWNALAIAKGEADPAARKRLRRIQDALATAPATMRGPMRWLVLVMVQNRQDCHRDLRGMLAALPQSDFSVYHYDSHSTSDEGYAAFAKQSWYATSSQVVHRGFVTGSGCTVEALKETIGWMLHGAGARRYTHLWKVDSDLSFGLFSYSAFSALVAHRAPFLSQPAIVPMVRGKRSTDRASLRAVLGPQPTDEVMGRERLLLHTVPPQDDVEIMCPLIDARILPAVAAAIEPMDTRNDVVAGEAINTIAQAFADEAFAEGANAAPPRPRRPGGLVFDYVPLIHRDSRLLGWGSRTRKEKNGTKCPRSRLDGRFGRGAHPHHGRWRKVFKESTVPGTDYWSWLPLTGPA